MTRFGLLVASAVLDLGCSEAVGQTTAGTPPWTISRPLKRENRGYSRSNLNWRRAGFELAPA